MMHTPGPWRACNNGECSCKVVGWKDHPVAKVFSGEWGDEFPSIRLVGGSLELKAEPYMERFAYGTIPEDEAKANARLISAAPDMREALTDEQWEIAFTAIDRFSRGEISDLHALGLVGQAVTLLDEKRRAAIAKAEGKSET